MHRVADLVSDAADGAIDILSPRHRAARNHLYRHVQGRRTFRHGTNRNSASRLAGAVDGDLPAGISVRLVECAGHGEGVIKIGVEDGRDDQSELHQLAACNFTSRGQDRRVDDRKHPFRDQH